MSNVGLICLGLLIKMCTQGRWVPSIPRCFYSNLKSNMTSCDVSFNKRAAWQLKSCTNRDARAPSIILFPRLFSLLCLSWSLNAVAPLCVHCSLDSLAGSNTGTRRSCLLCCITHCLPVPVCVLFPVHQTIVDNKLLRQRRERCIFYAVEGCCQSWNSITYSETLPDVSFRSPACWLGVACHGALLSPQWLTTLSCRRPTDRCWLTNQKLSNSNLCCGASRLTAFCVTVTERNRWLGTAWNWPSCSVAAMSS